MDNKEIEIEEMARVICGHSESCEICLEKAIKEAKDFADIGFAEELRKNGCDHKASANALTNIGYRKQSETVKEFAEKVIFMVSDIKANAVAGFEKYGKDSLLGMNYAGEAVGIDKVLFAMKFLSEQYEKEEI